MRITGKKYVLQAGFDKAFTLVGRSTNAALSQAFLMASDEWVKLIGSDGEQSFIAHIDSVDVVDPVDCLMPPIVHDAIKACDEDDIELSVTDQDIIITSGAYRGLFKRESLDFPEVEWEIEDPAYFGKDAFNEALRKCELALKSSSIRPAFAYVQLKNGVMQATDGSKLHRVDFSSAFNMLLPVAAVPEILKHMRSMAMESVGVGETDNCYIFQFDYDALVVTKHSTDYPDVESMMLQSVTGNTKKLSFVKDEMVRAVKRVALSADADTSYLGMELQEDLITLSALDKFGQQATERCKVYWKNEARTIGVNYQYFLHVLEAYDAAEVNVYLGDDAPDRMTFLKFDLPVDGFLAILARTLPDFGEGRVVAPAPVQSRQRNVVVKNDDVNYEEYAVEELID